MKILISIGFLGIVMVSIQASASVRLAACAAPDYENSYVVTDMNKSVAKAAAIALCQSTSRQAAACGRNVLCSMIAAPKAVHLSKVMPFRHPLPKATVRALTRSGGRTIPPARLQGVPYYEFGGERHYSDGSSSYDFGGETHYNDGSSSFNFGGETHYSDGTSSHEFGGETIYSDGRSCTTFAGSTVCSK